MCVRMLFAVACLVLPALVLVGARSQEARQAAKEQPSAQGDFAKDVVPFLKKYCTECHSGQKPKGDIDLSKFTDFATANRQTQIWERVVAQLRAGEMPPTGKPKPSAEQRELFTNSVNELFLVWDCTKSRDPGRITFHRLNKNEYNNTIRDLLGVTFKPAADFPSDDVADVFDNNADVLALSPLLMEKYFAAAEKIMDDVFRRPVLLDKILVIKPPPPEPVGPASGVGGKAGGKGPGGKGVPAKVDPNAKENAFKANIKSFLAKAYRRPVTDEEVGRFTRFIQVAEKDGEGAERALQLAMQAAICSPHFLFRMEKDFVIKDGVAVQPISQYELASRLSYFLWSSMPDAELFDAAAKGKLHDKEVLEAQIRRMLKDDKAQAFCQYFPGQWLQLRSVTHLQPDPKMFPAFDAKLAAAMVKETELFFEHIVKDNRSVLEFLDADWTFLNERLAAHYGIAGVEGEQFQKVKLVGEQRVGLLTQASILSVTSNPTRTSPTKRGKWILENILNTPPPPPLPNVPALSENQEDTSAAPLRKRMELHRTDPGCASCHQRMDPMGFGFENFDAIGAWRTKDGKFDVDASGEMPGGQKFSGPKELVSFLKKKDGEFRRCLVEKMLTYALGRGLHLYDKCAVDEICSEMIRNDDRMHGLVLAIVRSDPFQKRKGREK